MVRSFVTTGRMATLQYVGLVIYLERWGPSAVSEMYMKKSTRRRRGPRGVCGKHEHDKRVGVSSVRMCFASDRPKDDATALFSSPWRHIGDGPYWAGLR